MMACEPSHLQGQGVIYMTDTAATGQQPPQPADQAAQRSYGDLQRLVEKLTGWRPWHSNGGALYATRAHQLTTREIDAELHRTVCADAPDDLAALIVREQQRAEAVAAIRK
jgi:hypothetical protein